MRLMYISLGILKVLNLPADLFTKTTTTEKQASFDYFKTFTITVFVETTSFKSIDI